MDKLKSKTEDRAERLQKYEALVAAAEKGELSAEQKAEEETLSLEIAALDKEIEQLKRMEEKKKEIEATIAKLDSASEGMMTWMHEFKPEADSTASEEKVREYLEREMERVKKVKEDILEAIEKAKSN